MAWIEIGWIGKPHGLKGAFLLTGSASALAPVEPGTKVRLGGADSDSKEIQIETASWMPKGWKIQLSGITSPEAAKVLHGTPLFLEVQSDEEDGFFPSELAGFEAVELETDLPLGTFDGIEYLPVGPDRWWFKRGDTSWCTPATEHYVRQVDEGNRRILLTNVKELMAL